MSNTYCECVFVALGIELAMTRLRIAICGLSSTTIFFPHYLINGKIFEKETLLKKKMCFGFSKTFA
jgi:hypothetical protein